MMMSEEVASEKWCPMVRAMTFQRAVGDNPAVSRPTSNFNCIASGCMMWRWQFARDVGYCGLAGRPEVLP